MISLSFESDRPLLSTELSDFSPKNTGFLSPVTKTTTRRELHLCTSSEGSHCSLPNWYDLIMTCIEYYKPFCRLAETQFGFLNMIKYAIINSLFIIMANIVFSWVLLTSLLHWCHPCDHAFACIISFIQGGIWRCNIYSPVMHGYLNRICTAKVISNNHLVWKNKINSCRSDHKEALKISMRAKK